jgi:hypothetical protein
LLAETLQAGREWDNIFKVLEEKSCHPWTVHPAKPSFKNERAGWRWPVILATQEVHSLKQPWADGSRDPISKNPTKTRAGGVVQGVVPEFQPNYCKKKKKEILYQVKKKF